MPQQVLIIGLGQFGMSLARTLSEKGAEVLAVDRDKPLVEEAAAFVTEALTIDATDEAELARLQPARRTSRQRRASRCARPPHPATVRWAGG